MPHRKSSPAVRHSKIDSAAERGRPQFVRHKHPAFKALRDTVAFVVLCVALQGYVARTDGAEAAAAFRTVWPTLAFFCSCGALLVYWAGAALPLRVSALFSAMGMALQVSLHPANANELKIFCLLAFVGCICTALVFALLQRDAADAYL